MVQTVAVLLSLDKWKRSGLDSLAVQQYLRDKDIEIKHALNVEEAVNADAVIHKALDSQARSFLLRLEKKLVIIDPLENVQICSDRWLLHEKLNVLFQSGPVRIPFSILWQPGDAINENWPMPMIIKPRVASKATGAHLLTLVTTMEALKSFLQEKTNEFVLQEWHHDHGNVVFKHYVTHPHIHVTLRPSIKSVTALPMEMQTVLATTGFTLDSQTLRKTFSKSHEIQDIASEFTDLNLHCLDHEAISAACHKLAETLGISLFGVDVILAKNTFWIVDVNYMPGYENVPNWHIPLRDLLERKLK